MCVCVCVHAHTHTASEVFWQFLYKAESIDSLKYLEPWLRAKSQKEQRTLSLEVIFNNTKVIKSKMSSGMIIIIM